MSMLNLFKDKAHLDKTKDSYGIGVRHVHRLLKLLATAR